MSTSISSDFEIFRSSAKPVRGINFNSTSLSEYRIGRHWYRRISREDAIKIEENTCKKININSAANKKDFLWREENNVWGHL
jgi:hypothetical protein